MSFEPPASVRAALDSMDESKAAALRAGVPWCDAHRVPHVETDDGFYCAVCRSEDEALRGAVAAARVDADIPFAAVPPKPSGERPALFLVSENPQSGDVKITLPGGEAHTRTDDPGTSHAAAATVGDLRASQSALYDVLKAAPRGLTDEELIVAYALASATDTLPRQSDSGIRTRRSELVDSGIVMDGGERRVTEAGRLSIVWKIA